MPESLSYASPDIQSQSDRTTGKIIWRLVPFLCLLFIVNYLDRTNVAMAKLAMKGDLGISDEIYGRAAGLFFIGYFIFELPSNLILERVGARRWIARIMITWGIISSAMMLVRGPASFYFLRFMLGIAEAGFFPGCVLYLTYWIPQRRRSAVMAAFLTSTAVSGIVGNPLGGAIMDILNHRAGLQGWQWLFLIEGLFPIILGLVVFYVLPDRPSSARWLSPDEKRALGEELHLEKAPSHDHIGEFRHALVDPKFWLLSLLYFLYIMGLYGFVFWVPTIIKESLAVETTTRQIGFLAAIPNIIGAVAMVLIGHHSDRTHERRRHIACCALIAATGFAMVSFYHSPMLVQLSLGVGAVGVFGSLGPFWSLATRYLKNSASAGGIAIVNSIGGLAGFVANDAIGKIKVRTGHLTYGLLIVSASLLCGAALVFLIPRAVDTDSIQ